MTTDKDLQFMQAAIDLACKGSSQNEGGPFGTIIIKEGIIIGRGNNKVLLSNDPTAHAEMVAIRDACRHLKSHQLTGCTIYTSCEPCPMCLGAIYWARPDRIVYACTRQDAASIDFDDDFIYQEIELHPSERHIPTDQCGREQGLKVFEYWKNKPDKKMY
jgi:tRNA(Arg) A34 adenosine deaminase TadA